MPWPWVRPRLVLAGPTIDDADVPVLSDMDGKAHGAYGLDGRPVLVWFVLTATSPSAATPTRSNV